MEGFFVFGMSNDLIFKFGNEMMNERLSSIAKNMKLIGQEELSNENLSSDVLMLIFNPLLSTLRFMYYQFENSFTYVKCKHGFNMVFDESFGFLFITINDDKSIDFMQRLQGVYKVNFLTFFFGSCLTLFSYIFLGTLLSYSRTSDSSIEK